MTVNREKPEIASAYVEKLPSTLTAEQVFVRLARLPGCAYLDSRLRHLHFGRYSYVAADPIETFVVAVEDRLGLKELRRRWEMFRSPRLPGLPPFQGGMIGICHYELNRAFETLPRPRHDPFSGIAASFGFYDVVFAFDHFSNESWVISSGYPERDPLVRRDRATGRLQWFREQLLRPPTFSTDTIVDTPVPPLPSEWMLPTRDARLFSNFTQVDYCQAVRRAIEYIQAGDVFQINLSQRLVSRAETSPVQLYLRLRERTAAPFSGYFDAGEYQVVSASPERFISLNDGKLETRPIKGTRRSTQQPEADLFAGADLVASEKDRAENIMIVDLMRNDLARICTPESVQVTQLCGLESYGYIQHLVSVVEGRLNDRYDWTDVIASTFPGGSITGAPKPRAMEIITELECVARGPYCGSLGYVGWDGTMDLSILIRTIVCQNGWWHLPVGGGIVAQSQPALEYEETWHKAVGMMAALS